MCVFSLIEEGGDWDRRNRLKVYLGLYSVMMRDFKTAAAQFLDTVATFTSYELMDYETFVIYTIFSTVVAMSRTDLRDKVSRLFFNQRFSSIFKFIFLKVSRNAEILEVLHGLPQIKNYLFSIYECRYNDFFKSLGKEFLELNE